MTHDHRARLARARRAGLAWFIAAFACFAAQVALWLTLGDPNPINDLIQGSWWMCLVFGYGHLGWQRGYREGRAEERQP